MEASGIVYYMGASYVILAFFKLFGFEIDPIYIFCASIAALFFLLHDFWEFMHFTLHKIKGKNIKRFVFHNKVSKFFLSKKPSDLLTYFAVMSLILLPHIPWLKKMPHHKMSLLSDFTSLLALGLTMVLIGFKQLKADSETVKKNLISIDDNENF